MAWIVFPPGGTINSIVDEIEFTNACVCIIEVDVALRTSTLAHRDAFQARRACTGRTGPNWQPEILLRSVLDSLRVPLALIDDGSRIIATNKTWRSFVKTHYCTKPSGRVGEYFDDIFRTTLFQGLSSELLNELHLVLAGERKSFAHVAHLNRPGVSKDFRVRVTNLSCDAPQRSIATIETIRKPARTATSADEFGKQALEIRADERRRFAMELHDSVGQYFTSLELLLTRLRIELRAPETAASVIQEMSGVLKEGHAEIRTLSYLLSPPWIDYEGGLERAIRGFVQAFAKRAGLKADIEVNGPLFELDQSRQLTLFRIVQEALVNVHRHANADLVSVKLAKRGATITLQVTDNGTGFASEKVDQFGHGAGLAGMRARMKGFGGRLHLDTSLAGTILTATFPGN